jgi:hypothetical protein
METTALTGMLVAFCLGVAFFLLGAGLAIFGFVQRKKAKTAETWPTASGSIVSSRLDQSAHTEHDDEHTYTSTSYRPVVEYTYEVGGKSHQGNRVFPGASMSYDHGTAQGIVNRYQPGAIVTVHYDPADPTQAVLETKSKGGNLFLILGAGFAVLGIVGCCIGVILVFVLPS